MRVLNTDILQAYWAKHPDTKKPLGIFLQEVSKAQWKTPHELKRFYATASIISGNKVVFNIGGNKHRLVALIQWREDVLLVDFIGTHAEYDKLRLKQS